MKLEYTPDSITDIQDLKEYIAKDLKNKKAAKRIGDMIVKNCKLLKEQPMLGMSVSDRLGEMSDLRYLVCESWFIFYRIVDNTVQIARVIDGRTDYINVLFR